MCGLYAIVRPTAAPCGAPKTVQIKIEWERIVLLYDALMQIGPSPIVALNRAVVVGMAQRPSAGLAAADEIAADPELTGYHLLPSVRGELLMKMGNFTEAHEEVQRAIPMTQNLREQQLLTEGAIADGKAEAD
jgi:predicted RNA polymerase sigma factor